jgi:hypothetical protein
MIEVKGSMFIPFDYMDKTPGGGNLGRAEFAVCVKFKGGKVAEFWVYPVQQRRQEYWHFAGGDCDFTIGSYEGLADAKVWRTFWCKEHKTTSLEMYAPDGAKFLRIDYHGISFTKTDWGKSK